MNVFTKLESSPAFNVPSLKHVTPLSERVYIAIYASVIHSELLFEYNSIIKKMILIELIFLFENENKFIDDACI